MGKIFWPYWEPLGIWLLGIFQSISVGPAGDPLRWRSTHRWRSGLVGERLQGADEKNTIGYVSHQRKQFRLENIVWIFFHIKILNHHTNIASHFFPSNWKFLISIISIIINFISVFISKVCDYLFRSSLFFCVLICIFWSNALVSVSQQYRWACNDAASDKMIILVREVLFHCDLHWPKQAKKFGCWLDIYIRL